MASQDLFVASSAPDQHEPRWPNPILPLAWFTPIITGGLGILLGVRTRWRGRHLLFGDYNNGHLHDVVLTADRRGISSMTVVYHHSDLILSMERGPDGGMYFSDSNGIFKLVNT
jgi:hypothetical protein